MNKQIEHEVTVRKRAAFVYSIRTEIFENPVLDDVVADIEVSTRQIQVLSDEISDIESVALFCREELTKYQSLN
ncbi:MAG: hypothetical protein WBD55_09895 [Dehalococcoidia bacterium]